MEKCIVLHGRAKDALWASDRIHEGADLLEAQSQGILLTDAEKDKTG